MLEHEAEKAGWITERSLESQAKEVILPLEDDEEMSKVVDWTWSDLSFKRIP